MFKFIFLWKVTGYVYMVMARFNEETEVSLEKPTEPLLAVVRYYYK
jgi:hypothetical protein